MTGSFLFVKPTSSNGESRTIDPDKPPQYPYDHASWEWLLERALRRTLLPWALTKSHSRVLLQGHEDKYSMHRWGSYGDDSYTAGTTPSEYWGVGGPGSDGRKTDADLSKDDRYAKLPESWNNSTEAPTYYDGTKVAYGVVDLEEKIAYLPFSLEWLHPDWSSSALNAWDLTAETVETTQGSAPASPDGYHWTWETTVNHIPFTIPDDVPFKCLSHMRTDDDTVTVEITNDGNEVIEVETAPTPLSAPRALGGSIREYHGTQVRISGFGAAYGAGWALSEFYIQHRAGLDYSPSTGSSAYDRNGKTTETSSTIGCLVDIPDMSKYIAVSYGDGDARFVHDVDWSGKQTWWHANGFPKGLDSVLSPKLKDQLNALCPKCQPAIPPAIPAFDLKFPDAGRLPWNHLWKDLPFDYFVMYPQAWMQHLTLACTPFDMSTRLDAMTTTVHHVTKLFAKIKKVTTKYSTNRIDKTSTDSNGTESPSWSTTTDREETTVEGTSSEPIPTGDVLVSVTGRGSSVMIEHGTESYPSGGSSWSKKTQYTWEESFKSNSDFLVCLRSTENTTLSVKTTKKTSETSESSYGDPSSSETETSDGKLPNSYDPDPDDLLFPDWILPWIETAELFASIKSRLGRTAGADYSETHYHYDPHEGEKIDTYSGSGSGTRTHKVHRKIVSLGEMDMSTGRFPAIDAAAILSEVDPDPTEPTGLSRWGSSDYGTTKTTDSDGNYTEENINVKKDGIGNYRSRSVSYYVVVKWNFDRTKIETLKTE